MCHLAITVIVLFTCMLGLCSCDDSLPLEDDMEDNASDSASSNGVDFKTVVLSRGKNIDSSQQDAVEVGKLAVQLFQSCSDRNKRLVTELDWGKALRKHRCVRVDFPDPVSLDVKARPATTVTSVLVSLDADKPVANVLARNVSDIYSQFTNYDQQLYDALNAKMETIIAEQQKIHGAYKWVAVLSCMVATHFLVTVLTPSIALFMGS